MNRVVIALSMLFAVAACTPAPAPLVSKAPAGGVDLGLVLTRGDGTGYKLYWASSLRPEYPYGALGLTFRSDNISKSADNRCVGRSIRPVSE